LLERNAGVKFELIKLHQVKNPCCASKKSKQSKSCPNMKRFIVYSAQAPSALKEVIHQPLFSLQW